MNIRSIPRTAVKGSLRAVRLPLDAAIGALPGGDQQRRTNVKLALDRADATALAIAGSLLRDGDLLEDAQRRRRAADERGRALKLRDQAERRGEQADAQLQKTEEQAEQRRRKASQQASQRRQRAAEERTQRSRRAAQAEQRRTEASRQAEERTEERIEEQGNRERLDALETEARAERQAEEALVERDESRRLGDAAARAKAERKDNGAG